MTPNERQVVLSGFFAEARRLAELARERILAALPFFYKIDCRIVVVAADGNTYPFIEDVLEEEPQETQQYEMTE